MRAVAVLAVLALAACGGGGVAGAEGEWIEGRALSVRVSSTTMGGTLEVRNDSDQGASFAPLRITVNGDVIADLDAESAGESTLAPGESFTFPIMTADAMREVKIEMGDEAFTVSMAAP